LRRLSYQSLRVELHRATESGARPFHGLDNSVGRARNDLKAARDAVHGLMVAGVHAVEAVHRPLQCPVLRPHDLVREGVGFRIAVAFQMRNQCAANATFITWIPRQIANTDWSRSASLRNT